MDLNLSSFFEESFRSKLDVGLGFFFFFFFTFAASAMPPPGSLYRALYDFEQRNPDELSFYAGDIISVSRV
jgi:hypothetical protein